ncbi:hypothetical protein DOY81_000803 [Sarcophaga bullata]|nr:hypothetical protein DOY81_000803 [Sarcophaga bullata]
MDDKTQLILNGYRESNRELTKTNQEMRLNVRKFFDETLRLRAELMKKHETEIILRNLLYQSIIDNCLQLTEIVKPDADILPLLRESIKNSDKSFSHVIQRSKSTERRSTQLTAELRRSNSFINNRDSVRSISPLRRRRSSADVLEESSCKDTEEEQLTRDDQQTESNGILYEESDEEDWSQYVLSSESERENIESNPDVSDGVIQPCESVRDVTNTLAKTIVNSKTQNKEIPQVLASESACDNTESIPDISDGVIQPCDSLRDVTNILAKTIMDRKTQNKDIQMIRGQKQKTPSKLENSRELHNFKKQNPSKKRGRPLKNKSKESESSEDEDEVQRPLTINSIDFFEAPSSTPNKEPATSISSSLPVRKCRPKTLVEPSTKTKLRNTTCTKKK